MREAAINHELQRGVRSDKAPVVNAWRPGRSGNALYRWWRRSSVTEILSAGLLAIALLSSAIWFLRDIAPSPVSREGTLLVNINTATVEELETLPGVGPALARLIIAGRPYASADDLTRVKGIGPATVESLRPFVTISGETEEIR